MNRLSGITEGGWSRTYGYDRYGNRRASGQNVFADTPQNESDFDAATNRLTSAWADYDAAGNLTRFKPVGFQFTIEYDAENRQTGYCPGTQTDCSQVAAGSKTTYAYDGDGRRVKKIVNGAATTVYAYDASGNLAAEYTDAAAPAPGTYYRTTDHLGSTRLITNGLGAAVSRRDFFPFGEEIPANSTFGNRDQVTDEAYNSATPMRQQFTGQERDAESDLDYFGARYLGASMGRFMSPDPLLESADPSNPQTWNRYAYVSNRPLILIDPTGLRSEEAVECAMSSDCTLEVPVIVFVSENATPEQQKFTAGLLAGLQKDFESTNIKFNFQFSTEKIENLSDAAKALGDSPQLGILLTTSGPAGQAVDGNGLSLVNVNRGQTETNTALALTGLGGLNTATEEVLQQFLGFTPDGPLPSLGGVTNALTDFGVTIPGGSLQSMGIGKGVNLRLLGLPGLAAPSITRLGAARFARP